MNVQIVNLRKVEKGALKAFFKAIVHLGNYVVEVLDCRYFESGSATWCSFPQKEIKKEGLKSDYIPFVRFSDKQQETEVKEAIVREIKNQLGSAAKKEVQDDAPIIW
jgi:hypothetical protein